MLINKLVEETEISFPLPLDINDFRVLLVYLNQQAKLSTSYETSQREVVGDPYFPEHNQPQVRVKGFGVKGKIKDLETRAEVYFKCQEKINEDDNPYLSGLEFDFGLSEHHTEHDKLLRQVKSLIIEYFKPSPD